MFSQYAGLIDQNNANFYPVSELFIVKFLQFRYNRKTAMPTGCTEFTAKWK